MDGAGEPINQLAQSYVNKMRANIQEVFAYRAVTQQKLIRLYMATLSRHWNNMGAISSLYGRRMANGIDQRIPTSYGGCRQYNPTGESGI